MIKQGCRCRHENERAVFAVWTENDQRGGTKYAFCRDHLNEALDATDDHPECEPAALDFVISKAPVAAEALGPGERQLLDRAVRAGLIGQGIVVSASLLARLADWAYAQDLPELATYYGDGSDLYHQDCGGSVWVDKDGVGVCDCDAQGRV